VFEFGTAGKNICTKTVQRVYAQWLGHPPNTHWQGEPVTFLVVMRKIERGNTKRGSASTLIKKGRASPHLQGFYSNKRGHGKITASILRFVHACCIRTHMGYEPATGSGGSNPEKNSGRVARWRFKCFARDSFLPMQKGPETAIKLSARLRGYCEFATSTKPFATAS
jgi:hypothetical protein